jgi:hypothetical protein
VSEVNNQHKLDDDETEATDHAEDHPRLSELSLRYEECSDDPTNHKQILNTPEPEPKDSKLR